MKLKHLTNKFMLNPQKVSKQDISLAVSRALEEDIGSGDITARLIAQDKQVVAHIISKDQGILCGIDWAEEVFNQLDSTIVINWQFSDGESLQPCDEVVRIEGPARAIMSGERSALNFLQTLSATATLAQKLVSSVQHTKVTLLDTRKTLPGLRTAQKYAVRTGGATNHRMGLYDAFLIKENHIAACGGIEKAIESARRLHGELPVEIEVQHIAELKQAMDAGADIVMLDNFTIDEISEAVAFNGGKCKLEASGGIVGKQLVKIAETGVDYISIGALTKNCQAFDFSLLIG